MAGSLEGMLAGLKNTDQAISLNLPVEQHSDYVNDKQLSMSHVWPRRPIYVGSLQGLRITQ